MGCKVSVPFSFSGLKNKQTKPSPYLQVALGATLVLHFGARQGQRAPHSWEMRGEKGHWV